MKINRRPIAALSLVIASVLASAATQQLRYPYALTGTDPTALLSPQAKLSTNNGRSSRDRVMGTSSDHSFTSGLFASEAGTGSIESYPVDEFMYFVSGDMALTSSDGATIRLRAGDAVHVPRGWRGTWQTSGYKKFYVVYDASKK